MRADAGPRSSRADGQGTFHGPRAVGVRGAGVGTESASATRPGAWAYAVTCLKIGTVGFGGGYAVLDLIRAEVVERHRWLASEEFDDILAAVQLVPGPTTVNLLAAVGERVSGWASLVLGVAAVILPSFAIVVGLTSLYLRYSNAPIAIGAMAGLAAAVIGLMVAVTLELGRDVRRDILHWAIALVAFAVVAFTTVNPIWLIVAAAAAGGIKLALRRH